MSYGYDSSTGPSWDETARRSRLWFIHDTSGWRRRLPLFLPSSLGSLFLTFPSLAARHGTSSSLLRPNRLPTHSRHLTACVSHIKPSPNQNQFIWGTYRRQKPPLYRLHSKIGSKFQFSVDNSGQCQSSTQIWGKILRNINEKQDFTLGLSKQINWYLSD